jgi:hypothetical protein
MGRNNSGNAGGGGEEEAVVAREFVLKVAMHCRCHGCTDKVRAAVRNITLDPGVEAADSSAAESSGELRLRATADPERLRRRLRKATGKKVDLLLPKPKEPAAKKQDNAADAAALAALLAQLQLQHAPAPAPAGQQYGVQSAAPWPNHHHQQQQLFGGWNNNAGGYGAAYPRPPSSSSAYYPDSAWGGYGYAPPAPTLVHGHGNVGYYGASAPAWRGY